MSLFRVWGLLAACLVAVLVAGCSIDEMANDEERARLAVLDEQRAALEATLASLDARVQGALEEIVNAETPEEGELLVAQLAGVLEEYDAALAKRGELDAQAAAIEREIAERAIAGPLKAVTPWLPAWAQWLVAGVGGSVAARVAALLKGERSREHIVNGLKDLVRGKVGQALRSLFKKAPGLVHTNETARELLDAAEFVAVQEADEVLAARIRALKGAA
jgi:hypothetical protein